MSSLAQQVTTLGAMFGETPMVRLADSRIELFAKLEFCNPNGSSKDRSAYWILKEAIRRGDITQETVVIESSSGNFAISMAAFCRTLGITFLPVIDPNCNALTEAYLDLMCPEVIKVTETDARGSYLGSRLAMVQRLKASIPNSYWPNQYANLDAERAHFHMTGAEIVRALPKLDYLFVGVSTGGTIAGISRRVKRDYPGIQVIAVDAEGSAAFGQPPKPRLLPGLGSSLVPELCTRAIIDDFVIVPEVEAVRGCMELVRQHGIYAGGSSGSVYAAINRYFNDRPMRSARPTVAFLCADRGIAYADTVYNPEWVLGHYGVDALAIEPLPC